MDANLRTGRKNSVSEHFVPDLRAAHHISFMHVREVNAKWVYPSHEHKQYEINYVLRGCQEMVVNGKACRLEQGDFVLIRPGDIHSSGAGSADGFVYFCLHFEIDDPPLVHLLGSGRQPARSGRSPEDDAGRRVLDKLASVAVSDRPYDLAVRTGMQASFYELLSKLCSARYAGSEAAEDGRPPHSETAHLIESLIHAAAKQPIYHGHPNDERPMIGDIARRIGISESHCNRLFKKVYGVSPRHYLSGMIRDEAMRLLRDTSLSVDHISHLLGYRDIAHFSRQFKRWTGVSPRDYRMGVPPIHPCS
ncbi:AraC family transcriptional regulator [Cohnella hongkongensis]|uniref:AraC family transcriptional regulator n=1 Tax=Cohnella hongkongensis TaxID=178337 RepID=A0ABV9FA54_9BACL